MPARILAVALAVSLSSLTFGYVTHSDLTFWESPCPFHNAAARAGWINRTGLDIDRKSLGSALTKYVHLCPDAADTLLDSVYKVPQYFPDVKDFDTVPEANLGLNLSNLGNQFEGPRQLEHIGSKFHLDFPEDVVSLYIPYVDQFLNRADRDDRIQFNALRDHHMERLNASISRWEETTGNNVSIRIIRLAAIESAILWRSLSIVDGPSDAPYIPQQRAAKFLKRRRFPKDVRKSPSGCISSAEIATLAFQIDSRWA